MAQTGYTPILLYSSSTGSQAPAAGNLTNSTLGSELAINITDGKLFYKDNANAVQVIAWKVTPTTAGGTGLTSYTAGDLLYYATGTTLTKLAIGAAGTWLGSSGSAPQWNAPAALTKTDDTNVTLTLGGSASTALLNAASLTLGWTGTLAVSRGGTGTGTAFTAGSIIFAGTSGVYSQNNAQLFWDNANGRLGVGTATPAVQGIDVFRDGIIRLSTGNNLIGQLQFFNSVGSTVNAQIEAQLEAGNAGGNLRFYTKAVSAALTEAMRIDAAGSVGIGTVPSAWSGLGGKVLQNDRLSMVGVSGNSYISNNWYSNGAANYYIASGPACQIRMADNTIIFNRVGTGTAGNTFSWSESARIHSSGGVSIGNTTDPGAGALNVTDNFIASTSGKGLRSTAVTQLANNGTKDFSNFSGFILVNNWNTGGLQMWIVAGGGVTSVSTVSGGASGTMTYVAGINGYRFTNTSGSTQDFGFGVIQTRDAA